MQRARSTKRLWVLVVAVTLTAALVVFAASACGGSTSTTTTASATSAATASTTSTAGSSASATTSASTTASSSASQSTTTTGATTQGTGSASQTLADLITKYKQVQNVSFAFTVSSGATTASSGKEWEQAGGSMKVDATAGGQETVVIINQQAGTMTMYQPATHQGETSKSTTPFQDPTSYAKDLNLSNLTDLGTEVISGDTCRVVQFTGTPPAVAGQTAASYTAKIWISERLDFPLQEEVTTAGTTVKIQFTNISFAAIPSDTFTVPSDVKLTTVP